MSNIAYYFLFLNRMQSKIQHLIELLEKISSRLLETCGSFVLT